MDELLAQFFVEGRDLVQRATADLGLLAQTPGDGSALDSAFRAVHTLKGSVAVFGLVPAEDLLHTAEDILDRARSGQIPFDGRAIHRLQRAIDRVDAWIDNLEATTALPRDAGSVAAAHIGELRELAPQLGDATAAGEGAGSDGRSATEREAGDATWAAEWFAAESARLLEAPKTLTVFRYRPDRDCFFRGEDPLALALAVPELILLRALPSESAWPELGDFEPFQCVTRLEGASGASADAVRAAFRLAPGQVEIHRIDRDEAQAPAPGARRARETILRVEASRVDRLADGLGELIVAVNGLARLSGELAKSDPARGAELRAIHGQLEQVSNRLQRDIGAVRSVPLAHALRRLPRLVREIAETLGKTVDFRLRGESLEVDKRIADVLFEPLLHLVRNAIDHGAEQPEDRVAAGKEPACRITLQFERAGDRILVRLSDDGRGIDAAAVRDTAVKRGLIGREAAEALSEAEAVRMIFLPGFSTAGAVTSTSGRGVGMDAVQAAVEELRGTVDIASALGTGTTVELGLPVNALTTRLLVVEAGGHRYGIALDQIAETVRIDASEIALAGSGEACVLRDRTVPVVSLSALLGGDRAQGGVARLIVTEASGERVAIRVDALGERIDAVVRPATGLLGSLTAVAGSTLLGDGKILLIVDLAELLA
ncbi:chemotaxis protein CheA [Sphingopyxis sp. KK2]|uniref:chemotaxis protein CheA n=1 Tax=Sphingopyxis sp. KK2 TaxID=1855727 RepID=UPI00097E5CFB|nr:chemotaxis protein CheA [Sphingopyxis sp. KK2]